MLGIRKNILSMGHLATQAVRDGSSALLQHDAALARAVSTGDAPLNLQRQTLEDYVYERLSDSHSAGAESRWLVSAIMVGGALERIGDSAASLAYHALRLQRVQNGRDSQRLPIQQQIGQMAEIAVTLVSGSVQAYLDGDHRKAEDLVRTSHQLHELYEDVLRILRGPLPELDPGTADDEEILMLWAAHNLERIADFTISICERTIYLTTGELKEFN